MCILYMANPKVSAAWRAAFSRTLPEMDFREWPDIGNPDEVHYLITWEGNLDVINMLPNLRAVYAAGAGVDQFDMSNFPKGLRLIRLVDESMADIMAEYVLFAVLALHRDMLIYRQHQIEKAWDPRAIVPAAKRRVGVMGAGQLGLTTLKKLEALGFQFCAWNRSLKTVPGGQCFVGNAQLGDFLAQCDILVNLLPLTAETSGIFNKDLFRQLPRGAGLVNVGRGAHLVEDDLLDALEDGTLGGAVLDVFTTEPPEQHHPFWTHPRILVTPHIASNVQVEGSVAIIAQNMEREALGMEPLNVVDTARGY
ncbi:2-hydroxyacid dehydrogenase [Pseudomonas gingeri]|uniref:2-hydroxyacid dehydrogenase n=1 Tax=Pseudomonas gingeri TaxID=117681 RepID=UPI0015A45272|nr:glyoxylate/hydroxypyruvate reductase A [Pseudomonas gingeri]NWA04523.1 glyoxylate/hydroxypyruvate reductase A [Pseudomonas gingeri]NWA17332.1 glyoxylate/hydroxypyruvate reductase A [Pseudomonas gingeri]NWA56354.1 glyoxylate/hydroxypyruvate reductase A [Pseudomonas gingeri]NWA98084.1 glyoxylate/hydroxypyruvate reductase A [Pseudomonas gingeri]NWB02548.1 glyoxylate/hydroxypyruvate reductase A [Pseudomonas gingeri]